MALDPDVVIELVLGISCFSADQLQSLAEKVGGAFLPELGGTSRKTLATCGRREALDANVLSIGIWGDANGFSDSRLRRVLASQNLLTANRTIGILVTAEAIQELASKEWAETEKKIGRIRLADTIDVDVATNKVTTRVKGTYEIPVLPDFSFTYTVIDRLSLEPVGTTPPLKADSSTDVDVSALPLSIFIGVLSPILGSIAFFAAGPILESRVPDSPGVGAALASQWPTQALTPSVPGIFPPGKLVFSWLDLTVNETGILTLGTSELVARQTRVSIRGPRNVVIQNALGYRWVTYTADFRDLDPLSVTAEWSGAARGSGVMKRVLFSESGVFRLRVTVEDDGGGTASDEITVSVLKEPLEPGPLPS